MAIRFQKARQYTEKYRGQFVSCKFCGNTDIRIWTETETFGGKPYWTVCCMTPCCDAIRVDKIRDAVRNWNERQMGREKHHEVL